MVISIFLLTKFIKYLVNQIVFFGWLVYDLFSHIPFFSFRYLHQSETIQQITHRAKPNVHRFWGNFVSFPPPPLPIFLFGKESWQKVKVCPCAALSSYISVAPVHGQ